MNPFIPLQEANIAIVDGRISDEIKFSLEKLGIRVIKTIKCNDVEDSIAYHPDIVIHPINHNTLVIAPNVFHYYEELLKGLGLKLIKGEKLLGRKYPDDIAYNVGRLSGVAIHNFKYTDEVLKFYFKKEKLELIDINQGYSKCSLSIVNNHSAITSDYPMYEKLTSYGFSILLITQGYIILEGQKYGFIGGTTGNLCNNNILISGNLDNHPNKDDILNFIFEKNGNPIFLSNNTILDIGTIITLYCH